MSLAGGVEGVHPEAAIRTGPGIRQVWGWGRFWLPGGGSQGVQFRWGVFVCVTCTECVNKNIPHVYCKRKFVYSGMNVIL